MHLERCGQPHGGRIDWKIAALDGLGLILFFIPGVIAFVVDFSTGAIYLPEPELVFLECVPPPQEPGPVLSNQRPPLAPTIQVARHSVSAPAAAQPLTAGQHSGPAEFNRVFVARHDLLPQRIEQVVTDHVGCAVMLNTPDTRLSRLPRLDRFASQRLHHHTNRDFGFPVKAFFDGLQRAG